MVNLSFTTEELFILDKALQELPYGQVVKLINNINKQLSVEQVEE